MDEKEELKQLDKLIEAKLAMQELNFADRARLISQGALMNFSDEFFAMIRSIGTETYDEAITDERDKLKKAQGKDGSLKYEIGGAMLPLAFAPFTGGATIAPTIARYAIGTGGKLATQGAIQGATSSVGRQEGNIVDRVTDNKADIATSTATGAILNPLVQKVGGKLVGAVTKIAEPIIRKIKGQLGKPIEDELARIAKTSGLEVDEIIEQIALGKTIPELSETVMAEIRGFYSKAGSAKPIIRKSLQSRKIQATDDVFASLEKDLAPNLNLQGQNVSKFIKGSLKNLQRAASNNYDEIYKRFGNFRSNNLNLAFEELLQRQPSVRNKLRRTMTALGKPTPFEVKDGVLKITQDIDLRTAEEIRGLLKENVNQLYTSGNGRLGEIADIQEKNLRNIIDEISPELAMTRESWSKLKDANTAFKLGQGILSKKKNLAELEFDNIVQKGDMNSVAAFRAGVADTIQNKGKAQTRFITDLSNIKSNERAILEYIYPNESLDNIVDKINLARASSLAEGKIIQGSQTAETLEAAKRVGTVNDAYALARFVVSGGADLGAGVQLLDKIIPKRRTQLTQDQMTEISELLISENKDLLRRSLTNAEARETLVNNVARIADLLIRGGAKATVQEATNIIPNLGSVVSPAFSEELDPNMNNMETENIDTTSIKNLADELSPKTRKKVLKIYADGTYGEVYDDTGEEVVGTRRKPTQN